MTIDKTLLALMAALRQYDWKKVDQLCTALVTDILGSEEKPAAKVWKATLGSLRKKRCFACMGRLAEALVYAAQDSPLVQTQYAQSLIDRGLLVAAERVLQSALAQYGGSSEEPEFRGLLGRVLKQWYVNTPRGEPPRDRATLQAAIDWYMGVYRSDRTKYYWHGINVVALLDRGRRDGIGVSVADESSEGMAREIAATSEAIERPYAFDIATALEARIALNDYDEALARATEYVVHPDSDAFEVGSTLRQLEEVWQLTDGEAPGSSLLPLLRGALLHAAGGSLMMTAESLSSEPERVRNVKAQITGLEEKRKLERVFGVDRFQNLDWYEQLGDACRSVARIETTDGQGLGTGWVIRAGDWFDNKADNRRLLITNAHVICPDGSDQPFPGSSRCGDARARFQVLNVKSPLGSVVFSSGPGELDCTIATVNDVPAQAKPLTLASSSVRMGEPPPRMFIIGHPRGGDLQFSLQDNYLIGCTDKFLRYRTPTEPGSSGSPVFDGRWRVVGLHHAGDSEDKQLEANEGIALSALLAETRRVTFQ